MNPSTSFSHKLLKVILNLVLYYCRLLAGYCFQDFDDLILHLNDHHTEGASQEILSYLLITNEKDTKPYILKHLDNIK